MFLTKNLQKNPTRKLRPKNRNLLNLEARTMSKWSNRSKNEQIKFKIKRYM